MAVSFHLPAIIYDQSLLPIPLRKHDVLTLTSFFSFEQTKEKTGIIFMPKTVINLH